MAGMNLTPGSKFGVGDLLRPGALLGLAGLLILLVSVVRYAWSSHGVDLVNHPELGTGTGAGIKSMVWMVCGVGLTLFGALMLFIDFQRR